jgi:hypothetical protein
MYTTFPGVRNSMIYDSGDNVEKDWKGETKDHSTISKTPYENQGRNSNGYRGDRLS